MESSRHVRVSRTTEVPSRTYHITKHHYKPIIYTPGVEYSREPDIEHKVITGGGLDELRTGKGGRTGTKAKNSVVIHRTAPPVIEQEKKVVYGPKGRTVVRSTTSSSHGGGPQVQRMVTTSNTYSQPESFVNLQRNMESELNRRKTDWEGEVERMQHSFFDMKTSDSKKQAFGDSKPSVSNEILTIGDSKNLFHEQQDGSRVFRQKFDLHGFDTDDLSVSADDGKLTITASKEEEYEGASSMRQFNRTVDIPECVDTDQISSFLEDDGILTIEAPVDESKIPKAEPSLIRRTETREVSGAPDSFLQSAIDPPEYSHVVESSTSRSSGGPASSSFSTRTRYLGPDVEDTPYGRKLKTSLYVGKKYKPEDITVKLYDYKINVDAKSEEMVGGRTSRRQFGRDVDIPGPVERDTFQAVLGEDGRLYLGASFTGNDDHQGVAESVDADMPIGGKSVNIMY